MNWKVVFAMSSLTSHKNSLQKSVENIPRLLQTLVQNASAYVEF
jgi:hypothetical protein